MTDKQAELVEFSCDGKSTDSALSACLPSLRDRSETCFQRLSNNSKPVFTDQELATLYLFGHLQSVFEKKAIHKLIDNYWQPFFPLLPAYQTFVARLNLLEPTLQAIGGYLQELLATRRRSED